MKIKVELVKIFTVEVEAPEFLRPVLAGEKEFYELEMTRKQRDEYCDWYDKVEEENKASFLEDGQWSLVEDV